MRSGTFLLLLAWLGSLSTSQGQVKVQNLYFNSTQDIVRLNFSGALPQVSYTGVGSGASIGEGIAHVEDPQGNPLIWVNAGGVYDRNGTLMPGSTGLRAHPSSTEIVICPFPGDATKFYVFYNSQLCSGLYFSVVDLTLRGGAGDVTVVNAPLDVANAYAEGLEIVKIPCSRDYWLLAYQCDTGFRRFRIGAGGIETGMLIHSFNANNHQGRGELDYHNGKLGYAVTYRNRAFVAEFNAVDGSITHPRELSFAATNGVYGLEFSPDASKAYFTDWNNRDFFGRVVSPNLFQYDFTTGLITSWTLPTNTANCPGAVVEGFGQIELARDGNLYLPHVGGCQLTVVENPNAMTPTFSVLDVSTILSAGVSDPIQSEVLEPALHVSADQTTICAGKSVLLTASGGSGVYQWRPTEGLPPTTASIVAVHPTVTTTYTLYATTAYGCRDSVSVVVDVIAPLKPSVELVGNNLQCGHTAATLRVKEALSDYQWLVDGSPLPNAATDSLVIRQAGVYSVSGTRNGCPVLSDPVPVDPRFFVTPQALSVPNVFTPDGDGSHLNETFVIEHHSGKISLLICNRWGQEVFRSEDYQNDWAAEGLPVGLYYYYLTQEQNCFPPVRGWVQVLR